MHVELPRSPLDMQDEVAEVDLDGDGRPETLISSHYATSNGLGHVYRTLVVLRDGREVLRYDSGELTATTALISRNGACHLASSHWESVKHPLRGAAFYLVERSFDPLSLRMDDEIAGSRAGETERLRIPFDPLTVRARRRIAKGTVVSVGSHLTSVTLRTVAGSARLASRGDNDPFRLGDAHNGHVYPLGFETLLAGREANAEKHEDGTEPLLWLAP
jgi:hypothetical protein